MVNSSHLSPRRIGIAAALVVIAVIGWHLVRDTDFYLQFFGLDGKNTVYDYHTARIPVSVYWDMHMCNNGRCLTSRDWACGYENGDQLAVDQCFQHRAEQVPVWWRLDRLRKECGHSLMVYTGVYLDQKRCASLGGSRSPSQSPW
jgi:hypothetical protein